MTDLKKAALQALEALEMLAQPTKTNSETPRYKAHKAAITALRAALAQEEQEPVATVAMDVSGAHLSWNGKYLGQKPDTKIAMLLKDLPVGTLLFTAPPRREWQSLSEEEIEDMSVTGTDSELRRQQFSRAIEAALKERNQ